MLNQLIVYRAAMTRVGEQVLSNIRRRRPAYPVTVFGVATGAAAYVVAYCVVLAGTIVLTTWC